MKVLLSSCPDVDRVDPDANRNPRLSDLVLGGHPESEPAVKLASRSAAPGPGPLKHLETTLARNPSCLVDPPRSPLLATPLFWGRTPQTGR